MTETAAEKFARVVARCQPSPGSAIDDAIVTAARRIVARLPPEASIIRTSASGVPIVRSTP